MISVVFSVILLIASCSSHSWIDCSDYRINDNAAEHFYNPSYCLARPRNWKDLMSTRFAEDRGYNYLPGNGPICRNPLNNPIGNGYSATHPMAQYAPSQNVCLAWPSKNHVSASCQSTNIPDNGMRLYVGPPNPTADPTSKSSMTLVKDWGSSGPNQYRGFQHCLEFCGNNDGALCTGCFTVPSNLQVGATYTFYWEWSFNSAAETYSSCFEAQITGTPLTQQTSQQQTSQQTSRQQTSQQQTSQQTTRQQSTQQTSNQQTSQQQQSTQQTSQQESTQPGSSEPPLCGDIKDCVLVCGVGNVKSCTCENNQIAVECESSNGSILGATLLASLCLMLFLL